MKVQSYKANIRQIERMLFESRVKDIVKSGFTVEGKYANMVKDLIKQQTGKDFVEVCSSGTSALHLAFEGLKRAFPSKKKKVLIPTNTFYATARAAEWAGYEVQFIDSDDIDLQLDPKFGKYIDEDVVGVVLVHIGGYASSVFETIIKACHEQGLWVLEDAAQAYGSYYQDKMLGTFADVGIYSFFGTKVIFGGEGGALVTDNPVIADTAKLIKNFGKNNAWKTMHYVHGYNYRINEFSAALISVLLEDLDEILKSRRKIFDIYSKNLIESDEFTLFFADIDQKPNFYKVFLTEVEDIDNLRDYLKKNGIALQGGCYDVPLHKQPVYRAKNNYPLYYESSHLALPIYNFMPEKEAEYVVGVINSYIKENE